MASTDPNPISVSVDEAAARLGISRMTIYRLIRTDQLRTLKVGRRRLVRVAELESFAAARERASN
ncbi:helix-turn-helix domain-containing protein [Hydrogenophaga taeniospiralis]|uniref:helix-turn-helix domain-containing protein n=1 Tax=Hydrogenophaga taeniospiralis TaxID=65656 RepID=UPI001CFB1310|nr:helix-turn-helix domain-containing protein [Hydrogenophaga taeniospiralis]UCU94554.1 helix-turn-helix domain-containing protein [Hydrogenophaga taeniospiralis]